MRQVDRMHIRWPAFRVVERTRRFACWEGPLRPLSQCYRVRISLTRLRTSLKRGGGQDGVVTHPDVRIVEPLLRRRAEDSQEPIPHLYPSPGDTERPPLCLYDPRTNEWRASCVVANTIVPWTIDWLACYEGWLATGRWTGGGRHPNGTLDA